MAKFGNPFGGESQVWITQTYHGSSNTAIDCYWKKYKKNLSVYAIADGKITNTSSKAGSYCAQSVDGSSIDKIWYVHTHNWKKVGTKVKKGDKICEIAPKSKNGGYPEHLHLGLTPKGKYYIMDYFDRDIPFKTKYADIRKSWFASDGTIDWRHFTDRSYLPEDPCKKYQDEISKLKSKVKNYEKDIDTYKSDTKDLKKEITALQGVVKILEKEKNALESKLEVCMEEKAVLQNNLEIAQENVGEYEKEVDILSGQIENLKKENGRLSEEKNKAVKRYKELTGSRFIWLIELLEKVFPARESKKDE